MLQASMLTQPVVAVATGNRRRQQSGAAGPPVPASPAPTRRPSSLRGLTGQPSLRKDGATSQQAVATAEAAPVETTVPLAGMGLSDMSNAGETLREQLERRFKLEFAEPDEGSSTPKKVFIRRRSTAAQASSTQQKPREPSPVPQRAAGSPSPSGRTEQKRAQTTRARAAGATGASTGSQPSRSRRERESLPVLAPRATREGDDMAVKQEVLGRGEETEYISRAQEAFRIENIADKLREQLQREPTLEEHAEAAGLTTASLQERLQRGREARDAMVQHNLRLVASIARKYAGNNVPFQDLMQEGSVGLLRGLAKFDLGRGYKFSTYCHWWIRQAITRALSDQSRTVRIPIHVYDSLARIRKAMKHLEASFGREATPQEIADELNSSDKGFRYTAEKVEKVMTLGRDVASADALIVSNTGRGRGKQTTTLLDTLVSHDVPDDSALDAGFLISDVNSLIHTLEPLEREVLRMHYGLQGDGPAGPREGPLTFIEIGRRLGMTKERARGFAASGMQKLREPSRCGSLISYV